MASATHVFQSAALLVVTGLAEVLDQAAQVVGSGFLVVVDDQSAQVLDETGLAEVEVEAQAFQLSSRG